jgi:hypothetical protein
MSRFFGGILSMLGGGMMFAAAGDPKQPGAEAAGVLIGSAGVAAILLEIIRGYWRDRAESRRADVARYRLDHDTTEADRLLRRLMTHCQTHAKWTREVATQLGINPPPSTLADNVPAGGLAGCDGCGDEDEPARDKLPGGE